MNDTRRIARNSLFQAIGLGLQALTVFLIPLLMARRADPERLGEYITVITLVGLFAFISAYGFPSLLTREIARFRDDKDRIVQLVSTTVGLVVVLSLVAIGLMVVLGLVLGYSSAMLRALLLAGMALGVESMARVTAAAFRGIEAMQWSTAITSIMNLAFLVFAVVAIWFDAPIDWLIAAYLASRIVSLVAARWFFSLHFGPLWPRLDRKEWQALLQTGLPFSVNNVFTFAYGRLNIVILSILSGNAAVGFYEIALALTSRTNILAWTVTFALYPFLSSQHVQDLRQYVQAGVAEEAAAGNQPGIQLRDDTGGGRRRAAFHWGVGGGLPGRAARGAEVTAPEALATASDPFVAEQNRSARRQPGMRGYQCK